MKASTVLFCAATMCAGASLGIASAFPKAPVVHWVVLAYGAAVVLSAVGALVDGWGLRSAGGGWTEKVIGFGCNLVLFLALVAKIVRIARGYRYGPGP